jgi:hypothetical protein
LGFSHNWLMTQACICVTKAGGKLWRFKYRFADKEKLLSLGSHPEISLSDARKQHFFSACRKKICTSLHTTFPAPSRPHICLGNRTPRLWKSGLSGAATERYWNDLFQRIKYG